MTALDVKATPWSGGWELEIDDDHHTQVTTLDKAHQQVIDYLDTTYEDIDHSGWDIHIVPNIELQDEVREARAATVSAVEAQLEAALLSRTIARKLRAAGFSVTDTAAIMGVSRGRVSQLVKG